METQPEQPNIEQGGASSDEKEPINLVREAARDAGIDPALFPEVGTEAYSRLYSLAKDYSKEVHLEMLGREYSDSNSVRRKLHSDLCIMVFGESWEDVGQDKVKQVRNFAHLLSGRDQYVD